MKILIMKMIKILSQEKKGDSLEEKLQNDEKAINIIQGKEKG